MWSSKSNTRTDTLGLRSSSTYNIDMWSPHQVKTTVYEEERHDHRTGVNLRKNTCNRIRCDETRKIRMRSGFALCVYHV